jgi:shikimate kinase
MPHDTPSPTPPKPARIVLCGFMGSGKSTVGALLAAALDWRFEDLDTAIERRAQKPVPQIFLEDGEAVFRTLETAALATALAVDHLVLALGGGAAEADVNRQLLRSATATAIVFLTAPVDDLRARCEAQSLAAEAVQRPLLEDREAFTARYLRRAPLYGSVAHATIETAGKSPAAVVKELTHMLTQRDSV